MTPLCVYCAPPGLLCCVEFHEFSASRIWVRLLRAPVHSRIVDTSTYLVRFYGEVNHRGSSKKTGAVRTQFL